jgi:hypothetical protein
VIRGIIDLALRNRLLVLLLTVLVSLVGVIAYEGMPKDIYPDLNAPLVNIITTWPGLGGRGATDHDPSGESDERQPARDPRPIGVDHRRIGRDRRV